MENDISTTTADFGANIDTLLIQLTFGDDFDGFLIVEALILWAALFSTILFTLTAYRYSVLHINIRLLLFNQSLAALIFILIRLLQLFVYLFLKVDEYPIIDSVMVIHNGLMPFNFTNLFAMFIERTIGTVFAEKYESQFTDFNAHAEHFVRLACFYDNFIAIEFLLIPWTFVVVIKSYRRSLRYNKVNAIQPINNPEKERDIYFEQLQKQIIQLIVAVHPARSSLSTEFLFTLRALHSGFMHFFVINLLSILIERTVSTLMARTYEKTFKLYVIVFLMSLPWIFSFLMACVDKYYFLSTDLFLLTYMSLNIACNLTFLILHQFNKGKFKGSGNSLSHRYQLQENIQTLKALGRISVVYVIYSITEMTLSYLMFMVNYPARNLEGFFFIACIFDLLVAVHFLAIPWMFIFSHKELRKSFRPKNRTSIRPGLSDMLKTDGYTEREIYFRMLQQQWS
ncbi:hypothetical protein FO519_001376 [Halicephalobus sp. NKZ332]|nr:hypothetical protein FO519_001376 [Halicephalobus sp. NKZ332]